MLTTITSFSITVINHYACQDMCKVLRVVDSFNLSISYEFCAIIRAHVTDKETLRDTGRKQKSRDCSPVGCEAHAHHWDAVASMAPTDKQGR